MYTRDLFALPLDQGAYYCVYLDQVLEHPKTPAPYLELSRRRMRFRDTFHRDVRHSPRLDSTMVILTCPA